MPASVAHRCRPPTECRLAAVCSGLSSVCPPAVTESWGIRGCGCRGCGRARLPEGRTGGVWTHTSDTQGGDSAVWGAALAAGTPGSPCRPLVSPGGASVIRLPPGYSCDAVSGYVTCSAGDALTGSEGGCHRARTTLRRRGPRRPLLAAVK